MENVKNRKDLNFIHNEMAKEQQNKKYIKTLSVAEQAIAVAKAPKKNTI